MMPFEGWIGHFYMPAKVVYHQQKPIEKYWQSRNTMFGSLSTKIDYIRVLDGE